MTKIPGRIKVPIHSHNRNAGQGGALQAHTITPREIKPGSLTITELDFTFAAAEDVIVATINASSEGIDITADRIAISGTTTFAAGYDPSEKEDSAGVTTIVGNTITTGYVNALEITAVGAVTAGSLTGLTVQTASSGQRIVQSQADNTLRMYIGAGAGTNVLTIDDNVRGGAQPGIEINDPTDGGTLIVAKGATHFAQVSHNFVKVEGPDIAQPMLILNRTYDPFDNTVFGIAISNVSKILMTARGTATFASYVNTLDEYRVSGTRVVTTQGAAVANATDAASTMARLNDLLARCRAHGLIAT